MDRKEVEAAVENALRIRQSNSPSDVVRLFADSTRFRMAGSPDDSEIARSASTREELLTALSELVATWRWIGFEVLSLIVEGNKAAVRYHLRADHVPSSESVEIEVLDEMSFDAEGKILEFVEFLDTAKTEKLATPFR